MISFAIREAALSDLDAVAPLFNAYRQFYRKPSDLALARRFGRRAGAVRMTLSTELTNANAQALYRAEGWKLDTDFCVFTLALSP